MSGRAGQWWDILLIAVSCGARLHSRAALDPFPLEGRMELFLSRPQYSSSHDALMCFWGRGWEQNGCM